MKFMTENMEDIDSSAGIDSSAQDERMNLLKKDWQFACQMIENRMHQWRSQEMFSVEEQHVPNKIYCKN